jgi:hypothetical protein
MVKDWDLCFKIWTANGISETQFRGLNLNIECGNLQFGQLVCVEGSLTSTPPPSLSLSLSVPPSVRSHSLCVSLCVGRKARGLCGCMCVYVCVRMRVSAWICV